MALGEKPVPVVLAREMVEGEVAADGREDLGIFGQAGVIELLLRELAAREVASSAVDGVEPAGVLPGRGAEVDAFTRQSLESRGEPYG